MEYGVPWPMPPSEVYYRCASCSHLIATEYRPFCFDCGAAQPSERELRKRGWYGARDKENPKARRIVAIAEMNAFLADHRGCTAVVEGFVAEQNELVIRLRYEEDRDAALVCSIVNEMRCDELFTKNDSLVVRMVDDPAFGEFYFVEDEWQVVLVQCRFLEMYVNLFRS